MTKMMLILSLCLVLPSHALPVFADERDDCINGCKQTVAPCIEQARLSAGNIQEEQDLIAACEKNKYECIDACKAADSIENTSPPPNVQPPQDQTISDFNKPIKTYEFK